MILAFVRLSIALEAVAQRAKQLADVGVADRMNDRSLEKDAIEFGSATGFSPWRSAS
jgi:hypothetical protein